MLTHWNATLWGHHTMRLDEMNAHDLLDALRGYQDARAGLPLNQWESDAWRAGHEIFTAERSKRVDWLCKSAHTQ